MTIPNRIVEIKFGSHLYGTNTPNSDLDLKGIYMPTAREILLGSYQKTINKSRPKELNERNTKDDVDLNYFSLDRFLDLLAQGQTVALDMLFAPEGMITFKSDNYGLAFEVIQENKHRILNKKVNAFVGYALQQAAKYGVKGSRVNAVRKALDYMKQYESTPYMKLEDLYLTEGLPVELYDDFISVITTPEKNGGKSVYLEVCNRKIPVTATVKYALTILQKMFDKYGQRALAAEKNEGIDWKALSHAVRVNGEAKELLLTGNITFPRPDRELLLAIKTGQMEYNKVAELIETGLEELKAAQEVSTLRDEPDYEWIDNFVCDAYRAVVYLDIKERLGE